MIPTRLQQLQARVLELEAQNIALLDENAQTQAMTLDLRKQFHKIVGVLKRHECQIQADGRTRYVPLSTQN